MKKILALVLMLSTTWHVYAQQEAKIKVNGYLEAYYGHDFNKPADHNRPGFIYSHHRNNEVNLNLGFIKGSYEYGNIRANLAVMAGTYSNANMAAEPSVLKNIYEANAGLKLVKHANLWLDAGIFSSHIGFESPISKDCWVLTRSISAENTPAYESGAKITYATDDTRFTLVALYLNGWQKITRQSSNNQAAGGIQATFKPTDNITLNYSNYIGTEGADTIRVRRLYHNIYGIFKVSEQLGIIVGFDYGTQQKSQESENKNEVFSPVFISQYKLNSNWAIAGRIEYYKDKSNVLIASDSPLGFEVTGYSFNIDYTPVDNAVIRLEGKVYNSKDKLFIRDSNPVNHNAAITTSIAVSF